MTEDIARPADPTTFEAWYDTAAPRLFRALCGLSGDHHEAEELLAEAAARTWVRWDRVADPTAYTYRVGANLLRRRRRRLAIAPGRETTHLDAVTDPDLWAAVAALPRRQREVIVLRYVADLTERQVGEMLGLSAGTTSTHLARARAALRPLMEADDDD